MSKGFLYIAVNSSIAGLLKIGRTEKVPTARLEELFTTGVPEPFDVAYYALVQDSKKSEKAVHQLLSRYRHNASREFFAIGRGAAVRAIQDIELPEHEWHNPDISQIELQRDEEGCCQNRWKAKRTGGRAYGRHQAAHEFHT